MALPFSFSAELKWSVHRASPPRVHEYNGNLYAVLPDTTNATIEVWKSSDGGNSWAEQDAAHHRTLSTTAGLRSVPSKKVDTYIYVVQTITAGVGVERFDMSTDLWTTPATASQALSSLSGDLTAQSPVLFEVRSNGDILFLYQGTLETVMGTSWRRVKYMLYTAATSTWSTNNDVAGTGATVHYDARGIIVGSSDRTHFFWTNSTGFQFRHRSLTSGGTLNTDTTVGTGADYLANDNYHMGVPVLNGSEVVIPINGQNGDDMSVVRFTSADNPTWATTDVSTVNDPEATNANPGAADVDGSTVYLFWPNDADQDIYYNNDAGSNTWGTDTEWKDAITCQGISVTKITNGFGVLYDDGGTVKYDFLSTVVAPAIHPPFPLRVFFTPVRVRR